ncbi:MAG: ABC transporter substrate-binding protein [Trueperaceae bacterium]
MKRTVLAVITCIVLLASFGFAQKTLRFGIPVDPINLDPAQMSHMVAHRFVAFLYPSLLKYDNNLALVGDLAESYNVIDDTTYEFTLREGVTFHHGEEITSEHVKFSIERLLDPDVPSPEAFELEPITEVEIIDDRTFRLHTEEPFAPILHGIAFGLGIHSAETVEEYGDLRFQGSGSGPFELVEYRANEIVVFERYEDYDGPRPPLDRVEFHVITDDVARSTALSAGDLDVAEFLSPRAVLPLRSVDGLNVDYTGQPSISHFHLNTRREPFDDVRVRQAMSCALDRQAIADIVFVGDAEPTGPVPPSMGAWALPVDEFECYTRDLERSRELLAEAGYPDGFSSTMIGRADNSTDIDQLQMMAEQFAEVGIDMEIRQLEWGEMLDLWITQKNFDTLLIGSSTGRDPDANFYRRFHSESERNTVGYNNPEVDELMERGRTTIDQEERYEIYAELQRIIANEAPKIFTVQVPLYHVYWDRVQNWETHPMGMYYHLGQVDIEE